METSLQFLLSSLGVINGSLVGLYLLFKRGAKPSDRYFGALLLVLGIRIGKSVAHYYHQGLDPLIRQIGLTAGFFIGPFFFAYLLTLAYPQRDFRQAFRWVGGSLALLILTVGILWPYRQYGQVWNGPIIHTIYVSWALFVAAALIPGFRLVKNALSQPK
ncbi:MAG: AraC family transcriptional regulator, partial [Bacteroidota bacterium]